MTGPYCSANTFRLIKSIEITMANNWSQGELKIIKESKREREKKKGKFRLKRTREVVVNQDVIGMLSVLVSGPIQSRGREIVIIRISFNTQMKISPFVKQMYTLFSTSLL